MMAPTFGYGYTKRPGTAGYHGQQYEMKMACLMFLRAVASGNAFHLAANMDGAGAFDDLVLQLNSNNCPTQTFFIQLKHKLSTAKLVKRSKFLSLTPRDDFSLLKYFLSFRDEIWPHFGSEVSLVLYTNVSAEYEPDVSDKHDDFLNTSANGLIFSFKQNEDDDVISFVEHLEVYKMFLQQILGKLCVTEDHSLIIEEEVVKFTEKYKHSQRKGNINIIQSVKSLKNKPNTENIVEQLKRISDLGDLSKYNLFLKNLKVCTRQAKVEDIDALIQDELSAIFGIRRELCDALIPNLLTNIQKWWEAEKGAYLTETSPLWDNMLDEALWITNKTSIREMNNLGIRFNDNEIDQIKPSLACARVVVCLVDGDYTSVGVCKVLQALQKMHVRFLLGLTDNALGFWKGRWCNVLVVEALKEEHEMFSKIKEILLQHPDKNLIIVATKDKLNIGNLKDLNHIEVILNINFIGLDEETKNKVLAKDILFQGHEVTLEKLIHGHHNILEEMDTDLLVKIINDESIHFGTRLEKLVPHYISRSIQRADVLQPNSLQNLMQQEGRIFAFSGVLEEELQQLVPSGEQVCHYDGRLVPRCRFYLVDNTDFASLEERARDYMIVTKGDEFQVNSWSGNIDMSLFVDRNKKSSISPDTVRDIPGRVALITAEPGMGKSTLTTYMALRTKDKEPDTWVIRVNLNHMSSYLDTVLPTEITKEHAINFLTEATHLNGMFEKRLLKYSLDAIGNVVVFCDGFDEICPDYKDQTLMILQYLLKTNIQKLCVTSRFDWRLTLEQSLTAVTFTIEEFSSEDQRRFLNKFWSERVAQVDEVRLHKFISDILRLFPSSVSDDDISFLGVPLQSMIVAEVFEEHLKEGQEPKYMDLVQLYEEFFKKKCKVFFEHKRCDYVSHPAVKKRNIKEQIYIEEMHTCSAMVLCMSSKDISTLHDKSLFTKGTTYLQNDRSDWLTIGIIQSEAHGNPEFIHRTVMEFFVSKWLLNNYYNNITFLQDKMLSGGYYGVNSMLNIMLTKGFPLHTAALNSDVEYLKLKLNNENVNSTDSGGRTLLHVVLAGTFNHTHIKEIVPFLLNYGAQVDVVDRILQWSSIQYAYYSKNWIAMGIIMHERKVKPVFDYTKPCMIKAFVTACTESYVELFQHMLSDGVDMEVWLDHSGSKAIHVAVRNGQTNIVEHLLQAGVDVESRDFFNSTALYIAAEYGHVDVLECLLRAGANIEAKTTFDRTALHAAANNGHLQVVKILLNNGSQADVQDIFGHTPLDLANIKKYYDIRHCLENIYQGPEMNTSPLDNAVRRGDLDSVKRLITSYGIPYFTGENKHTPLHTAAYMGHLDIAVMLIEYGIPVNAVEESGKTPLYMAVVEGYCTIVRLLLDNGSTVDCPTKAITLLHLAASLGHLDIATILIEKGISVDGRDSENRTPLHHSAQNGHLKVVKLLLENNTKVGALDDNNKTALHYSASEGHLDITRHLIEHGSVTDFLGHSHLTPLHCATENGQLETGRFLIDKSIVVNARDTLNRTPLHVATRKGHGDVVRLLLEEGADVNATDIKKRNALHDAAIYGYLEIAQLLIDKGSVVNARDNFNKTAVHFATVKGHLNVVRLLIEKGANTTATDMEDKSVLHLAADNGHLDIVQFIINRRGTIDVRDKYNQTPLFGASLNGNEDVVQLLIEEGADVNATDEDNRSPLHDAVTGHCLETVQLLINNGSELYCRDTDGNTPLHYASAKGKQHFAQILINKGADVNDTGKAGTSALHFAADGGHFDVVQLLLDSGSAVDARDMYNRSPLFCATIKGHGNIVRRLIEKGADVNVTDSDHTSPLSVASTTGNLYISRFLIEKGADVNMTDVEGRSALHFTAMEGHVNIANLLLVSGGIVDARSKDHSTPLHYAARQGHLKMVKFLVEHGSACDAVDMNLLTPLDIARLRHRQDVVNFLVDKLLIK